MSGMSDRFSDCSNSSAVSARQWAERNHSSSWILVSPSSRIRSLSVSSPASAIERAPEVDDHLVRDARQPAQSGRMTGELSHPPSHHRHVGHQELEHGRQQGILLPTDAPDDDLLRADVVARGLVDQAGSGDGSRGTPEAARYGASPAGIRPSRGSTTMKIEPRGMRLGQKVRRPARLSQHLFVADDDEVHLTETQHPLSPAVPRGVVQSPPRPPEFAFCIT